MDKVLIFLVFLGPLIFFHELGHFLMARLFGVRVEVFSIGFGPKLFKFKWGETQYAFSLIPLGGYVKMFGDDPLSEKELTPDEQKVAFTFKSKWARFWIVFGGPLANFILAFFLYFGLLLVGEKVPQIRFGEIQPTGQYHQIGFRSGDILKRVNDDVIQGIDDLNLIDTAVTSVTVERDGQELTFNVNKSNVEFLTDFQSFQARLRSPIVLSPDGKPWLISTDDNKFNLEASLESISQSGKTTVYLYQIKNNDPQKPLKAEDVNPTVAKTLNIKGDFYSSLINEKYFPADLVVESIVMKSPADQAKIKSGDIIYAINGDILTGFEDIRKQVQKFDGKNPIKIEALRDQTPISFELIPTKNEVNGESVFTVGIYSGAKILPLKMVDTGSRGLIGSFLMALKRTQDGMAKTLIGFKNLILGEVSLSNLGGPIAIGKVASDSLYISISMFLRLMAIISINLGIINLFPIPVLDGGHITFILIEAINRGPLSRKKMEIAQQVGLSLLFILIFISLFNDVYRIFS